MGALRRWFTRNSFPSASESEGGVPAEAIAWRAFAVLVLAVCIAVTAATHPYPRLHGRDLVVLLSFLAMVGSALWTRPLNASASRRHLVLGLLGVIVAAGVLGAAQPHGIWVIGPYYAVIIAALRLDRRSGLLILATAVVPFVLGYLVKGQAVGAAGFVFGIIPWFLAMRLLHHVSDQRDALEASREAEARAAAAAERGRLAREMHDVLAHSLSALALQLESTRLLAHSRGVDDDVAKAIDSAHHLAASGLDEARRAIAAERGDHVLGADRIGALADAFEEQSGLPVKVEVRGQPRELTAEAQLAVYRTTQEALTNVRRHAIPDRVEITLDYLPDHTILVIEDHSVAGSPVPVAPELLGGGYGLAGMRERAELVGGELLAAPSDRGFRVELRLPAS
jgi:signal transduction histidine kinase